jgi:chromosome segregation ATPase
MLYTTARLKVPFNSTLDIYANPDGDFSAFRAQVQQAARERRDTEVDALTRKYEDKFDKLESQSQRKTQRLESEKRELANIKREELFTTGEAVLGLLKGRTSFTLSRMSRASVYRQRSKGQAEALELDVQQVQTEMERTQQEFEAALRQVNERWAKVATQVEEYLITPYKKDISIDLFGIGWIPYWYIELNGQPAMLAASE